ncbi:MAG: DUF4625 domain-containing protein [Bacteroidia bacterium]|nr:DUF4625 domain-containing protein [Bacteroidia bacterium]
MTDRNLFFLCLLLMAAVSCKQEDVTAPVLESWVMNQMQTDIEVTTQTPFAVGGSFSDNKNLEEYTLEIQHNFDALGQNVQPPAPWSLEETYSLAGKTAVDNQILVADGDYTGGPYHCNVQVKDKAGNASQPAVVSFWLVNLNGPQFSVAVPRMDTVLYYQVGDTIQFFGTLADDVDLEEVEISLQEKLGVLSIYDEVFALSGNADTGWNLDQVGLEGKLLIISAQSQPGEYELIVQAVDSNGNTARKKTTVYIYP